MSTEHGLFIPSPSSISNLPTFLTYLATTVRKWHECLSCGTTRCSTAAIQSHMRDSSHCKLNFEREPELFEFWEPSSSSKDNEGGHVFVKKTNGRASSSSQRLQIMSIKKARSKRKSHHSSPSLPPTDANQLIPHRRSTSTSIPLPTPPPISRALSRRDELGLTHISPQARHALILAEKRSQKAQETVSRASEWVYARKANAQKYDQAHGPLECFKGGNHKLLPR